MPENKINKGRISFMQKIKQDRSFRKRYIYYYALTFTFPIFFILLANLITQQIVREQVLHTNERTLKQFWWLMDEKIESIVENAYAIVLDQKIQEYAKFDTEEDGKRTDKKVKLIDLLREYHSDDVYKDVFVWFLHNDQVVSGMNPVAESSDLSDYCRNYYKKENFKTKIQEIIKYEEVPLILYPVDIDNDKQYFALSMKRFRTNSKIQNYVLTLVLDCDFINNYVATGVLGEGEDVLLFNKNGKLLYSYKKAGMETLPEECRDTGVYEVERDGKLFTFLVQKSEIMEGYYAVEISRDVLFEPLLKVRGISIATFFICIIVGSFVIHQMSRSTYRPLEAILSQLQKEMKQKFDSNKQNEFEFIAELMGKKSEKKNMDYLWKKEARDERRRKDLLFSALEGCEMNDIETKFLEKCMLHSDCFWGGVLVFKNCGKVGWDLLSFVITNIFEEFFEERCKCDILSFSSSRHVILLGLQKEENFEEIEMILGKGIDYLEQYLGLEAVFGIGNISNDLYGLHNLYREAQQALEYSFLLENESIIRYKDISERQIQLPFSNESAMFYMVNDFLKKEKAQTDARKFLKEVLQVYGINESVSMETVSYFQYEVINCLNRIWAKSNVEYFKRQSYLSDLVEAETWKKYLISLEKILCETAKAFRYNRKRSSIAEQIKLYIDENYFNPNLCVVSIGEHFGMQAAYLSKMFREEYGVLMLNYISNVRCSKAKKLLNDTDLDVKDIAEKTGFLSADVMIKTFKKFVGITPGKYRVLENIEGNKESS